MCSNIPAEPDYGAYFTQWVRYSRDCGSYHIYFASGMQLTRTLHIQGFIGVKLKSSLRKFYCRYHNVVNRYGISVSQMTSDMLYLSLSQSHHFHIHHLSLCL